VLRRRVFPVLQRRAWGPAAPVYLLPSEESRRPSRGCGRLLSARQCSEAGAGQVGRHAESVASDMHDSPRVARPGLSYSPSGNADLSTPQISMARLRHDHRNNCPSTPVSCLDTRQPDAKSKRIIRLRTSALNLKLMRLLHEQYTRTPFFGVVKMTDAVSKQGYTVHPKRVRRLLRQMGLEAIYPKPNLSKPAPGHRIYPYRLRDVVITRPNQVWSSDITYIRLRAGFIYLVVGMDWFSRYVLRWEISTSLDAGFCCSASGGVDLLPVVTAATRRSLVHRWRCEGISCRLVNG